MQQAGCHCRAAQTDAAAWTPAHEGLCGQHKLTVSSRGLPFHGPGPRAAYSERDSSSKHGYACRRLPWGCGQAMSVAILTGAGCGCSCFLVVASDIGTCRAATSQLSNCQLCPVLDAVVTGSFAATRGHGRSLGLPILTAPACAVMMACEICSNALFSTRLRLPTAPQ